MTQSPRIALKSVRPIVQYVDSDVAVMDVHLRVTSRGGTGVPTMLEDREVLIEVQGVEGFFDEQLATVTFENGRCVCRMEVVHPQRWWPAGMGDQSLYNLDVSLVEDDDLTSTVTSLVGLTSIRYDRAADQTHLLVNGEMFTVETLVPVDRVHENGILPAGGDSVMFVRDHYGTDLLYKAADHAGILLIQCVPTQADQTDEREVIEQVDRLASHPCLAGWYFGHLGRMTRRITRQIRKFDPVHNVFFDLPVHEAA